MNTNQEQHVIHSTYNSNNTITHRQTSTYALHHTPQVQSGNRQSDRNSHVYTFRTAHTMINYMYYMYI